MNGYLLIRDKEFHSNEALWFGTQSQCFNKMKDEFKSFVYKNYKDEYTEELNNYLSEVDNFNIGHCSLLEMENNKVKHYSLRFGDAVIESNSAFLFDYYDNENYISWEIFPLEKINIL